jgi:hypothetical protein
MDPVVTRERVASRRLFEDGQTATVGRTDSIR